MTLPTKEEENMNQHPRCGWCGKPPTVANISPMELCCATEGCPAFSNVVSAERWSQRGIHEMEVMHIPAEEPIFIMRGQDQLAMVPIYTWIDLAEKKNIPEAKQEAALKRANEMDAFQRTEKSKLPD